MTVSKRKEPAQKKCKPALKTEKWDSRVTANRSVSAEFCPNVVRKDEVEEGGN